MRMRERVGIFGVVVFLGASLCASAGLALSADTSAMTGWYGTLQLDNGIGLAANVDYAVYAPGTFGGSVPTNEYVYAYQAFSIGSVAVSTMTVGILEGNGAANAQTDLTHGVSDGILPTYRLLLPGSSFYTAFLSPLLTANTHSVVLLFTSPNGPVKTNASVINSGQSAQVFGAPTPLPEPATLVLLGLSGLAVIRRHRGV